MGFIIRSGTVEKHGEVLVVTGFSLGEDIEGHPTLRPNTGTSGGDGTGRSDFPVCVSVAFHAQGSGDLELIAVPQALTDLAPRSHQWFNASAFDKARVVAQVTTPGTATTLLLAQYSLDGGATWQFFDEASGPGVSLNTIGTIRGNVVTLAPFARSDIEIRCCTFGGDGVVTPVLGKLDVEFLTPSTLDTDGSTDGFPPGGVPSNPLAWHRADQWDGTGGSPGPSSALWVDLTGHENHLSPLAPAGTLPALTGDALAGKPTVRLAGTPMQWPTTLYDGATAGEGFVLFKQRGAGGSAVVATDVFNAVRADIDGAALTGGATWRHIPEQPGSPRANSFMAVDSTGAVFVPATPSPDYGDDFAAYLVDGAFGSDQGCVVTIERLSRASDSTFWCPELELLLRANPDTTWMNQGGETSDGGGAYVFFIHSEDVAVGEPPTAEESYYYAWWELRYKYDDTFSDGYVIALGTIAGSDEGNATADGVWPGGPGITTVRFEARASVLTGWINDVVVFNVDLTTALGFGAPVLSGGVPGFTLEDPETNFQGQDPQWRLLDFSAYDLSAPGSGLWRVGSDAAAPTIIGSVIAENFGSSVAQPVGATSVDFGDGFHLWNPRSSLGGWAADLDADLQYSTPTNTVVFSEAPLFGDSGSALAGQLVAKETFSRPDGTRITDQTLDGGGDPTLARGVWRRLHYQTVSEPHKGHISCEGGLGKSLAVNDDALPPFDSNPGTVDIPYVTYYIEGLDLGADYAVEYDVLVQSPIDLDLDPALIVRMREVQDGNAGGYYFRTDGSTAHALWGLYYESGDLSDAATNTWGESYYPIADNAGAGIRPSVGETVTWRLEVQGTMLRCFRNGVVQFEDTDGQLSDGGYATGVPGLNMWMNDVDDRSRWGIAEYRVYTLAPVATSTAANIDVAEVLLYARQLSDSERDQATAGISNRWNLGLTTVLSPPGADPGTPLPPLPTPVGGRPFLLHQYDDRYWGDYAPFTAGLITSGPTARPSDKDDLYAKLNAARAAGLRVIVLPVVRSTYSPAGPHTAFNLSSVLTKLASFEGIDIAEWVEDGTIIGIYVMDEPFCAECYGGTAIPSATIDDLFRRYKLVFGTQVLMMLRASASLMERKAPTGGWKYVDVAMNQYPGPKLSISFDPSSGQSVTDYIAENLASSERIGVRNLWGINTTNGGDGSSGIAGSISGRFKMAPAEILRDAGAMAKLTNSIGLSNWAYYNPPDVLLQTAPYVDALLRVRTMLLATP